MTNTRGTKPGPGPAAGRLAPWAAVCLLAAGCAWFRPPPVPQAVTPPPRPEAGLVPAEGADPGERDSTGAAPGEAAPGPGGAVAADTTGSAAGAGEETDDAWHLDGEKLSSATGPDGEQVLKMTRPRITHRGMVVTAVDGTYLTRLGLARLTGDVTVTDDDLFARGDAAAYDRNAEILTASGNVEIQGDSLYVTGQRLVYTRPDRKARLDGGVEGWSGTRHMTAQTLHWLRDQRVVLLVGDARVEEEQGTSWVTGDSIRYEMDRDVALVVGDPTLTRQAAGGGSTRVGGDRLWIDPSGDARAAGRVRVVRGLVTGYADSAAFAADARTATLFGSPRVEELNGTLHGDTLILRFDEEEALQRVDVEGNAHVRYAPTDTLRRGEVSIVEGRSLRMYFADGLADRIEVYGDARTSYAPGRGSGESGTNTATADTVTIFLEDARVDRVQMSGQVKGTYTFGAPPSDSLAAADTLGAALPAGALPEIVPAEDPSGLAPGDTLLADDTFLRPLPPTELPVRPPAGALAGPGEPPGAGAPADTAGAGLAGAPGGPNDTAGGDAPADTAGTGEPAAADTAGARPGAPPPPGFGPPPDAREKVDYTADRVVFVLADRTVELDGSATVDYGTLTLTAGKVLFYADKRYMEAEEDPVLVEKAAGSENKIDGDRMDYNLKDRVGTIDDGRTKTEEGFVYADRLRQIGPDDFLAKQGNSTTCDNPDRGEAPHFHFTSKRMRIYLGDKVVAKPVTLYIRDIPVLALPFYVFSIRKGRHSGFLTPDFSFGIAGSSGQFIRNLGYYWAASDYTDFTFSLDYQQNPQRVVGNVTTRYAKRYLMDGSLALRRTLGSGESQHDITAAHAMTLGSWRVTGRGEFRDADFRIDDPIGNDVSQRVDRILQSDLSASRSFDWGGSFSTTLSRREDLAPNQTDGRDKELLRETLPTYRFSLSSRTIGRKPDEDGAGGHLPFLADTRWSLSSSGGTTRTRNERTTITSGIGPDSTAVSDTAYAVIENRDTSARHVLSLSDARRVGPLSVGPGITVNENWLDEEYGPADTTRGFYRAATWSASMSANTTAYGTLGGVGPVQAVRHTLNPRVSFGYSPEFSGLTYFDPSDSTTHDKYRGVNARRSASLSLSADNRFQGKFKFGDTVSRVDLLNWSLNTRYDFLADDDPWGPINSTMDIPQRILGVKMSFNSTHDPYRGFRFDNYQARGSYGIHGTLPGGERTEEATDPVTDPGEAGDLRRQGGDVYRDIGLTDTGGPAGGVLDWNAAFTISYAGQRFLDEFETSASLNSSLNLRITRNWSVTYANTWRITDGEVAGESFTLNRDLHCWEASFTGNRVGDDTTFWFRIRIKDLPEVKYEQGPRGNSGLDGLTGLLP